VANNPLGGILAGLGQGLGEAGVMHQQQQLQNQLALQAFMQQQMAVTAMQQQQEQQAFTKMAPAVEEYKGYLIREGRIAEAEEMNKKFNLLRQIGSQGMGFMDSLQSDISYKIVNDQLFELSGTPSIPPKAVTGAPTDTFKGKTSAYKDYVATLEPGVDPSPKGFREFLISGSGKPDKAMALVAKFDADKNIKDYKEMRQKYESMAEVYKNVPIRKMYSTTDQAMITLFNKLTDVDSVVRESEYARTAEGLPLSQRLNALLRKWSKGGAITNEGLEDIMQTATLLVKGSQKSANRRLRTFKGRANIWSIEESIFDPANELALPEIPAQRNPIKKATDAVDEHKKGDK